MNDVAPILLCEDLVVGHAGQAVMSDINIRLPAGKIIAIVGPSGCGKSTLMRVLGGLDEPMAGRSELLGTDLVHATATERESVLRRSGFLFQGAALFSSLTLRENVELPLREFLPIPPHEIAQLAEYKLALVGLADAMDKLPSEISGGMAKRAGIARALALDPAVMFLDEPSAGLDPVTSGKLDELILKIKESFGTTIILVSHEVPSILRVADFCVYLDSDTGRMGAYAPPKAFLSPEAHPRAHAFFTLARIS
ncbi:MAG: ATP-binding cassette domain-containing protein [Verrucomicrobiota bacterium]|jgi:phospholipid/cholesterol/gamma-HCH transport system ATP-binding protein